ncbi:uncharacterized protein FJT64_011114 [Amphibalanus amphitrite]|uniref:Uncharacterized protein n=1 Tax=Amphibalanus amphitrite TaxID=1232801 RepID=A0A6A4VK36_AMPAM|nr:uncharacterized protein FJT64_011114 [Amphibalanus amphitrite]
MHDTSRRTKLLNNMEVHGVCQRCKDIIDWKIKYKKYKPLTAPKTCTKCHQKTITQAYRTICRNCASSLQVCEKCGESKTVIPKTILTPQEQMKEEAELEKELKGLPERKRRSLKRCMAKERSNPDSDPNNFIRDMRQRIEDVRQGLDDSLSDVSDYTSGEESGGEEGEE